MTNNNQIGENKEQTILIIKENAIMTEDRKYKLFQNRKPLIVVC